MLFFREIISGFVFADLPSILTHFLVISQILSLHFTAPIPVLDIPVTRKTLHFLLLCMARGPTRVKSMHSDGCTDEVLELTGCFLPPGLPVPNPVVTLTLSE